MPNLLSPPTARPGTVTRTNTLVIEGNTTISAGTTLYADDLPRRAFDGTSYNGTMLVYLDYNVQVNPLGYRLTNQGVIWSYQTGPRLGLADYAVTGGGKVTNAGLIVLENDTGVGYAVNVSGTSVTPSGIVTAVSYNTGGIYALSQNGVVFGFATDNPHSRIENTGVIAARSQTGTAVAIDMVNGGTVLNGTNGIIQAAGVHATAVFFGRGEYHGMTGEPYGPSLVNQGLIEAVSLTGSSPSIGIFMQHLEVEWLEVVNEGTIRADYALYANNSSFSPIQKSVDRVTNAATGKIEGTIYLAEGDDVLINRGTITGTVNLGDGNDTFDNVGGTFIGFANLGFGNDTYIGGSGADYVRGEIGDDHLIGNAGNDLLIGDWGNDTLVGGAGNDGLYGEFGDDTILTQDGDTVFGGSGNDRVVLGDYTFASVDGESGFDTLVMAGDGRRLDLSMALASGRIANFERIELKASDGLVVRSGDVSTLTGGAAIYLDGGAANSVHLVGSWTASGTGTFEGADYKLYALGNETVWAKNGLTVSITASAPTGASGLDAVASGGIAPLPGVVPGSERYSGVTNANFFLVTSDLNIDTGETWYSDEGNAVIALNNVSFPDLNNSGTILSFSGSVPSENNGIIGYVQSELRYLGWFNGISDRKGALAVYAWNGGLIDNSGSIYAESTQEGISVAVYVGARGQVSNTGVIESYAADGMAIGVKSWDPSLFALDGRYPIANHGEIFVESEGNRGIGMWLGNALATYNGGVLSVTGEIGAYGIVADAGGPDAHVNDGTMVITTTGENGEASAAYYLRLTQSTSIDNSGLIIADELIRNSYYLSSGSVWLTNSGRIDAHIGLFDFRDKIYNSGTIDGDIDMGGQADDYYNQGGTVTGVISGGSGADTAHYLGARADYQIVKTAEGKFDVTGAFGTDHLSQFEFASFSDQIVTLNAGQGIALNPGTADPDTFMFRIRDFDGNNLGGAQSWALIGRADANGDGSSDFIFVNPEIGRFAEVSLGDDGLVYFENHGWGGDTRVVGIYVDPLVESGEVIAGSDFDSQRRFQNDLFIDNIDRVLGSGDYDHDGLQEIYFALTDGTAYLHAYMHADGNIRYANYQSQQQVVDYMAGQGWNAATYDGWFA